RERSAPQLRGADNFRRAGLRGLSIFHTCLFRDRTKLVKRVKQSDTDSGPHRDARAERDSGGFDVSGGGGGVSNSFSNSVSDAVPDTWNRANRRDTRATRRAGR